MSINQYHCQCSCLISDKWSGGSPCHKQEWYASRVNTKRQIWLGRVNQNVSPHWTLDTGHCNGHCTGHWTHCSGCTSPSAVHNLPSVLARDNSFGFLISSGFLNPRLLDKLWAWWKESQSKILTAHICNTLKNPLGLPSWVNHWLIVAGFDIFPEK